MTFSGIESVTFRLVGQCLNQLRYHAPRTTKGTKQIMRICNKRRLRAYRVVHEYRTRLEHNGVRLPLSFAFEIGQDELSCSASAIRFDAARPPVAVHIQNSISLRTDWASPQRRVHCHLTPVTIRDWRPPTWAGGVKIPSAFEIIKSVPGTGYQATHLHVSRRRQANLATDTSNETSPWRPKRILQDNSKLESEGFWQWCITLWSTGILGFVEF
jgi:hypothetical protein